MRALGLAMLIAACQRPSVDAPAVVGPDDDPADTVEPPVEPPTDSDPPAGDTDPAPVDTAPPVAASGPFPIVLAHGFFGFETFAGLDFVTYFFGVRDALLDAGEPLVFTPAVDPFSDSETRGRQLLAAVEQIVAETGAAKVNLVAHSQGGLDARVVASLRPDLVASVTTISTPHAGTPVADVALGVVPFPGAQEIIDALLRVVAGPVWEASGDTTSLFASLDQLSTAGVARLARRFPDPPGVPFYSIAGRTGGHDGVPTCGARQRPRFITRWDDERDPTDLLLVATEAVLDGGLFGDEVNDGLVRVIDAKKGRFLGCIPADHLDEMGQLVGDDPGLFNDFDHIDFYVDLVAWLRDQGH